MTDEQVAEAKNMRKIGISTYRIAKMYGVSPTWICYLDEAKKQGAVPPTAAETVRFEQIEIRRLIDSISRQTRGYTAKRTRIRPREYLQICGMIDDGDRPCDIARHFGRPASTISELKRIYLIEKRNNEKPSK